MGILLQDEKAYPRTIPGSLQELNHFFIPKLSSGHQVFLPSTMVCKATPDTVDRTLDSSLQRVKGWSDIHSEKRVQNELVKTQEADDRQRRQQKVKEELKLDDPASFDDTLLDVELQQKLIEEAKLASRKQNVDNHYADYGNISPAQPEGDYSSLILPIIRDEGCVYTSHTGTYMAASIINDSPKEDYKPVTQPPVQPSGSEFYPFQGYQTPFSQLQSSAQEMAKTDRGENAYSSSGVGKENIMYT